MFPIRDSRGRVIAFGGRILDQGEPKYLNSPETALFHKGKELYGLYECAALASELEAAARRRGLHGHGAPAPGRDHLRGRNARHGHDARTSAARFSSRERARVLLRRRSRRARRRLARPAKRAATRCARDAKSASCSCPMARIRTHWSGAEGREAFEARLRDALPLSEYLVAHLSAAGRPHPCRWQGSLRGACAPAARKGRPRRLSRAAARADRAGRGDFQHAAVAVALDSGRRSAAPTGGASRGVAARGACAGRLAGCGAGASAAAAC